MVRSFQDKFSLKRLTKLHEGKPHTSNQTNHKAHTVVLLVNATAYSTTVDNGQLDHTAAAKKLSGFVSWELADV
jgi:hypothetical protein